MSVRVRVLVFLAVLFVVATLERYERLSGFVGSLVAGGAYLVVVLPAISRRDRG